VKKPLPTETKLLPVENEHLPREKKLLRTETTLLGVENELLHHEQRLLRTEKRFSLGSRTDIQGGYSIPRWRTSVRHRTRRRDADTP
jgi:hypothetical protein